MNRHWSDDQLLDRLYGLAGDDSHLESCPECAERWTALEKRRLELARPEPVSAQFLAAQRRAIYSRLGEQRQSRMKWAPALAAACLLIIGLVVYRPVSAPAVRNDSADAKLFSDVYSMVQTTEPQAATPIHELFEDNQ